jgi:hypothetical protein
VPGPLPPLPLLDPPLPAPPEPPPVPCFEEQATNEPKKNDPNSTTGRLTMCFTFAVGAATAAPSSCR